MLDTNYVVELILNALKVAMYISGFVVYMFIVIMLLMVCTSIILRIYVWMKKMITSDF